MHADGYAGFDDLYRAGAIREVACSMAHVRRKLVDVHRAQASPIAEEAIRRIARLYAVEKQARGSPPERRVALRQAAAAPVFHDLEAWLREQLPRISGKSPLLHPDRDRQAQRRRSRSLARRHHCPDAGLQDQQGRRPDDSSPGAGSRSGQPLTKGILARHKRLSTGRGGRLSGTMAPAPVSRNASGAPG
jgi:hypothetical protein